MMSPQVIYWLYAIVISQCQIIAFIWACNYFAPRKEGKRGGAVALWAGVSCIDLFRDFVYTMNRDNISLLYDVGQILFYIMLMVILYHWFQGNAVWNVIKILALDFLMSMIATIITFPSYIALADFNLEQLDFMDKPSWFNVGYMLVHDAIAAWLMYKIWGYLQNKIEKTIGFRILLVVMAAIDTMIYAFLGWKAVLVVLFFIGVLLIILLYLQNQTTKVQKAQYAYYQALERAGVEQEKAISEIRHDIANHMAVMEEMSKDEAGQELLQKIEKNRHLFTGISVIDCLIAEKERICKEAGIVFEKNGENIQTVNVTEYDLVSLFANLLDNAIEAAEKTEKPEVTLKLEVKQGYLMLWLKNTKLAEETPVKEGFHTTKMDKEKHGIGSKIIQRIVEKYNGRITYEDEGEYMLAKVMISVA